MKNFLQAFFAQELQEIPAPVTFLVIEDVYPLLFLSLVLKKEAKSLQVLDMTSVPEDRIKAQLETSFLGQTFCYRLSGLHDLPKNIMQKWLQYLFAYRGPNILVAVVTREIIEPFKKEAYGTVKFVDLPSYLKKDLFIDFFSFMMKREPAIIEKKYIDKLYFRTEKIAVENAALLVRYMQVLGSAAEEFFASWVNKLVLPDKSLFLLSQYFFAKQVRPFLSLWVEMKGDYPEQFWVSFWSEQLWRALFYCISMQKRDMVAAKKIGYRLPFSFLQKDYRSCDLSVLQKAHESLYELDYGLKNGASEMGLDLFLLRYFIENA